MGGLVDLPGVGGGPSFGVLNCPHSRAVLTLWRYFRGGVGSSLLEGGPYLLAVLPWGVGSSSLEGGSYLVAVLVPGI